MITFDCQCCNEPLAFPDSMNGNMDVCPECKNPVLVAPRTVANPRNISRLMRKRNHDVRKAQQQQALNIICPNPNCGYRGTGAGVIHGDGFLQVVLLLCGLIPGLLYTLFAMKGELVCPQCRNHVRWIDRDVLRRVQRR